MPLRSKVVVILSVVIGLYAVSDFFLQRTFVLGHFLELEEARAQKTTVRVKKSLADQLKLIGARCDDWTQKPATAELLLGEREDIEDQRLGTGLLEMQGLDLMLLCDASGNTVWRTLRDPMTGADAPELELAALPAPGKGRLADELLTGWREEDRLRGILRPIEGYLDTELGPLLVSSKPVVDPSGSRGIIGKIILGRFLAGAFAREVEDRTEARDFRAWFHGDSSEDAEITAFVESSSGEPLLRALDKDTLEVLHAVDGQVVASPLIFSARVDREISRFGEDATNYALLSMLAAAGLMLLVLLTVLQRAVLSPISALTQNAVRIGEDDLADIQFDRERSDEIGVLSREFDNMLEKLAVSRAALVDTARQAGQSEIATGILHNIGNVLNSVNVSSGILSKKAKELAVDDLEALNGIIAEHADDLSTFIREDPRGQHFPPFLDALTSQIAQSRVAITEEAASMAQGIERIRSMVDSQQDFVRRTLVVESVDLPGLVRNALEVCEKVEPFDRGLALNVDVPEMPKVPVDRHRVLEILVNLIQNARQAMEGEHSERRLDVVLSFDSEAQVASIEVRDSGSGIEPENLTRVFDHGFTTKPTGNGFGLHTAANAATEMGGSLTARSDGAGHGATFQLTIPTQSHKASAPAQ